MLELGKLVGREAGGESGRTGRLGAEVDARGRVDVNLAAGPRLWLHVVVVVKGHLGHAGVLLHEGVHLAIEGCGGAGCYAPEALLGRAAAGGVDEAVSLEGVVGLGMFAQLPERIRG